MAGDRFSAPVWDVSDLDTLGIPLPLPHADDASTLTPPKYKRLVDVLGSLALLTLLLPLLVVIAAVLGARGGPILFRHRRVGQAGVPFACLKFRTMVVDGDRVLAEHLARDAAAREEWARERKLVRDPRVTPMGAFLRKTSLDELPQLFNVLSGEMSLVGPRPVVRDELGMYGRTATHYLSVRPGITGLWQVSGRSGVTYPRRAAMDRYYVKKVSPWLDILILLKTVLVVIDRRGAY